MHREVILTGLRSNDEMTLGNYIGAILPMGDKVAAQAEQYNVHMFVPDLHSFTTPIDHEGFQARSMRNLKIFVAAGLPLDNPNIFIYRQSRVPAHSELTWILGNFTGFGELSRMVEFKDKAERLDQERVSVGLFTYPVLMAADILLYGAKWVPVGDDQRQHLEFTRDIAQRMNNRFGLDFAVPETLEKQQAFVRREEAPRIRSLRCPAKKMSKSIDDPAGTILLSDTAAEARKKIMSAETDSIGVINYDWVNQPGVTNLLTILAALTSGDQQEVNQQWAGKDRYGDLKTATADAVAGMLDNLHQAVDNVSDQAINDHLKTSEARMNEVANAKLLQVQKAIGLR